MIPRFQREEYEMMACARNSSKGKFVNVNYNGIAYYAQLFLKLILVGYIQYSRIQ